MSAPEFNPIPCNFVLTPSLITHRATLMANPGVTVSTRIPSRDRKKTHSPASGFVQSSLSEVPRRRFEQNPAILRRGTSERPLCIIRNGRERNRERNQNQNGSLSFLCIRRCQFPNRATRRNPASAVASNCGMLKPISSHSFDTLSRISVFEGIP
jgi:hypothetical protein